MLFSYFILKLIIILILYVFLLFEVSYLFRLHLIYFLIYYQDYTFINKKETSEHDIIAFGGGRCFGITPPHIPCFLRLIRLVDDFSDFFQILAHTAALCSQSLLNLADALHLICRQFTDSSEDQLFRCAMSFLTNFETRVGAQCISSDDEHIDTSNRLAGIFTRRILRSPVRNLWVEVRNGILEHFDEIGSPGRIGTSATQEDAIGVQFRVVIDLHNKTFPPFRTWQYIAHLILKYCVVLFLHRL